MRIGSLSGMFGLAVLALMASPQAQAQDPGWYLGAGLGQSKAKIDDAGINSGLGGAGFNATSIEDHNHDTAFKLFGGYQFNRYLALEGGYFNLGQFRYNAATSPAGTLSGSLKYQGVDLDAVGFLPLGRGVSLFARAGVTYGQTRDAFTGTGSVNVLEPNPGKNSFIAKFGGGLQYDLTRRIALRAEAERYRVNDAIGNRGDIDVASLGLLVRFGGKAATSTARETPGVPPPEGAAAGERTEIYCSLLDLEFDIDKDSIELKDKEKLKVVGTFLAKYPATTAVIEGHSDNVGSEEHNLKLSQERADSVVAYLVEEFRIAPSRLSAAGYGSRRPVADNATEEGKRQNRRINAVIACATDLQGLEVAPARVTMALVIEFDRNKVDLKPEYGPELTKVAQYLKDHPGVTATVEGHTGNVQLPPEEAMSISLMRAQNVIDYLVASLGIERARLTAQGFGQDRRFAYNTSKEGRQENRRVNIVFSYPR